MCKYLYNIIFCWLTEINKIQCVYVVCHNAKMAYQCSNEDYIDTIFIYRFCNGSVVAAVCEYLERCTNRRLIPIPKSFALVFQHFAYDCRLYPVRLMLNAKNNIVSMRKKTWFSTVYVGQCLIEELSLRRFLIAKKNN